MVALSQRMLDSYLRCGRSGNGGGWWGGNGGSSRRSRSGGSLGSRRS